MPKGILILFDKWRNCIIISLRVVEYRHGDIVKEEAIITFDIDKNELQRIVNELEGAMNV